ncbi:MAG: nitrite reductase small subunit NirD [Pseudomonadota bacterium]
MNAQTDTWIDVGGLEDIPMRGARLVRTRSGCVALFRTAEDEVYALDDSCPHKRGPLSEGIVHGRSVTCPLHNWVISLETGTVASPDEGTVRTHRARVEGKRVLLEPSSLTGPA